MTVKFVRDHILTVLSCPPVIIRCLSLKKDTVVTNLFPWAWIVVIYSCVWLLIMFFFQILTCPLFIPVTIYVISMVESSTKIS